jgi:D-tyrosyl-tRNA(Tyr) deacylase
MRAIIQRVQYARITINDSINRSIAGGICIFLGIENEDSTEDLTWLAAKIARLRIFDDGDGKMNLSLQDIDGEALVVSQFTLHASTKKGNRPSWIRAAEPQLAEPIYEQFVLHLQQQVKKTIATGEFGAHMNVELLNDGPVTIFIDTRNKE